MQLNARKRTALGKKAKKVRQNREIPAVIFGPDIDSVPIAFDYRKFLDAYREAGETTLVDVKVDEEIYPTLVKEIQLHPVTFDILHASLYKVNLKEKTTASIPVVIEGEESIDLVKSGEALVLTQLSEVDVEALPTDLPHQFVVDVSGLEEIGDSITVAELEYDREKVEIVGHEEDAVVVSLDYATIEEEEEEEELTEEELIEGLEAIEEAEEGEEGEEAAGAVEDVEKEAPAEESEE